MRAERGVCGIGMVVWKGVWVGWCGGEGVEVKRVVGEEGTGVRP